VRSSPRTAAVAALLVLLAGCSESTQGSPSPGGEPGTTAPTGETTEVTTGGSSAPAEPAGTADLQPCDLLGQSDLASLQLTGGEEVKLGSARTCDYRRQGATANETFTVSIALWDNQGLDDLNAPTKQPLPDLGGHKAVSFVGAAGACGVGIGVGDSSRVDSSAIGGDEQLSCQIAQQVATLVEPKLP
jgi:Protein of unknown function (DUF3558)